MSDSRNPKDYGQQFKIELEQALQSGDFSSLNQLVNDTVTSVVNGVADQVTKGVNYGYYKSNPNDPEKYYDAEPGSYKETTIHSSKEQASYGAQTSHRAQAPNRAQAPHRAQVPNGAQIHQKQANQAALFKKNGKISGTLMQVFGGVGVGLCGVTALVFLILYVILSNGTLLALTLLFFGICAVSLGLLGSGNAIKNRLGQAQRYFDLCKDAGYMNISQLAERTGIKEKRVVKDLRKLIENGTFPQGHLDQEEKCFMLTDKTYEEYRNVRQQRQQLQSDEMEQKRLKEAREKAKEKEEESMSEEQKQLRRMVEEGQSYILQIRQKNEAIPGEIISQKLYRMESLLDEIFSNLEKMPEQMPKMQKLMHYYLPTTLKLVSAYEQFDHMSVQGDDIINAKKEIENTIDTINDAYGELLNKLFADSAMDVTTDAQVLKTMLAKEGLVDEMK